MQDVALDACCLINLCAAGQILTSSGPLVASRRKRKGKKQPAADELRLHVPATVSQEVLYILQPDEQDETQLVKVEIDLASCFQVRVLHSCDLEGEEEAELFIQLATKLDDGEAACLAIAKTRGWLLATDDRPGAKLANLQGVKVITTPELVKRWAENGKVSGKEVGKVLQNIQRFARFVPRRSSPLFSWWVELVSKGD